MNTTFTNILFAGLIAFCTGPAMAAGIPFDGRNWVVGFRDADDAQTITEYVPEGQTIEKWTELVTISEFFDIQDQTTPKELMSSILAMAAENCTGLKKKLLQSVSDGLLFEWEVEGCQIGVPGASAPEFDISRIIFTKDRVFMMQYASRTRLTPEKRNEWINIISAAVFNDTGINP